VSARRRGTRIPNQGTLDVWIGREDTATDAPELGARMTVTDAHGTRHAVQIWCDAPEAHTFHAVSEAGARLIVCARARCRGCQHAHAAHAPVTESLF